MSTNTELLKVAALAQIASRQMEKTAVGLPNWLGNLKKTLTPSKRLQEAANGVADNLGNRALDYGKGLADRAYRGTGRFLNRHLGANQAYHGYRQIQKGWNGNGPANVNMISSGIKNLAVGGAKTGLLYGGGLYGASRLMGGSANQQNSNQPPAGYQMGYPYNEPYV